MEEDATPAVEAVPASLVTTQEKFTVPEALGVKVTVVAVPPPVMVPPVTDQA